MTTVFEVDPCDTAVNYIWALNSLPYIARRAENATPAGLVRFVNAWQAGFIRVFFCMYKGKPIGMVHLVAAEDSWQAHIAFDKSGWGNGLAEDAGKKILAMTGDLPIEAFIPSRNRLAVALARRIGQELGQVAIDDEPCTHFNFRESPPCHN